MLRFLSNFVGRAIRNAWRRIFFGVFADNFWVWTVSYPTTYPTGERPPCRDAQFLFGPYFLVEKLTVARVWYLVPSFISQLGHYSLMQKSVLFTAPKPDRLQQQIQRLCPYYLLLQFPYIFCFSNPTIPFLAPGMPPYKHTFFQISRYNSQASNGFTINTVVPPIFVPATLDRGGPCPKGNPVSDDDQIDHESWSTLNSNGVQLQRSPAFRNPKL
ncbi:MAG: hypothetical protein Ct9H300mP19_20950 [Dehalococcoidia bacterium]|nr:MAG: hypothetical protein Ct9H300mP19_20950 [Dehalococcoidia bacterium]